METLQLYGPLIAWALALSTGATTSSPRSVFNALASSKVMEVIGPDVLTVALGRSERIISRLAPMATKRS